MKLDKLAIRPFFTAQDAKKLGISGRMLSHYVKTGKIVRIAHGIYQGSMYEPPSEGLPWEDLAIAVSGVKGGVVCLISALVYYELTDERMTEFWIAVPNSRSKAHFPMSRIVRMRNMDLGVTTVEMAGIKVKIFDIERTIVDSFRLLDNETALKALKIYLTSPKTKVDLDKMDRYITKLRASKVRDYLTALLS